MKIVKVALIQRHANKSTKNTSNTYVTFWLGQLI